MFGSKHKQLHERVIMLQMELAQVHDVFLALDRSLAIVEFDRKGHVLSVNQNFLKLFGYSIDELLGAHHRVFCDEAYVNSDEYKQFWERLNQGQHFSGKFRRVSKAGQPIWLEATYNPVFNSAGTLQKIVKYASDITERVMLENENQSVINALNHSMAVIQFDLQGKILSANKNFCSIMGYAEGELEMMYHKQLCRVEDVESGSYDAFWTQLRGGEYSSGTYTRVRKDGTPIKLSATYNPCFDYNGKLTKIIKIAQPVV